MSERTFYGWVRRFRSLGVSEPRELRQLRNKNRKLKGLVTGLTLDKTILHEVLRKRPDAPPLLLLHASTKYLLEVA